MLYFKEVDVERSETGWYEFKGDWVNRQIVVRPDIVLLLKRGEQSEASLDEEELGPENEISQAEFQAAWDYYVPLPHGTTRIDHPLVLDIFNSLPGPTAGNITSWSDGFFRWDSSLDHVFAQLDEVCKSAAKPSRHTAPSEPALLNLSAVYAKEVEELHMRDLLVLVRWIKPWLQDDPNALRYYLPILTRFYWAGRAAADLELTWLLYRDQLTPLERRFITEVAVQRVRRTHWAWDAAFALFWCDDYTPLREPFLAAGVPHPGSLWYRLRELVATADSPLQFLWNGQYDIPRGVDFFDRLVADRGERILLFLREVGWLR